MTLTVQLATYISWMERNSKMLTDKGIHFRGAYLLHLYKVPRISILGELQSILNYGSFLLKCSCELIAMFSIGRFMVGMLH